MQRRSKYMVSPVATIHDVYYNNVLSYLRANKNILDTSELCIYFLNSFPTMVHNIMISTFFYVMEIERENTRL